MTQYKNPNYWFLFLSALVMIAIATASYFVPGKVPFATDGLLIKLYRINYAVLAMMVLLSNNMQVVRTYLIITGWLMIFFVVSSWLDLAPEGMFLFTKSDNILHSNIGVISIFIAVIYGDTDSESEETL